MKQPLQLGALSALTLLLSFAFQWVALTQLGPGRETDALFAGMTVPQLILSVVSGSLVHVLVPLLTQDGPQHLQRNAWSFMALSALGFGVLAMVLAVLAGVWVRLLVPGFDVQTLTLTIELTRITLLGMFLGGLNGVLASVGHARARFVRVELAQALSAGFAILLLLWALPRFGVLAAAWALVARSLLETLLLLPLLPKPVKPALNHPSLLVAWQRIRPLLMGATYYKTDPLVDRVLLSLNLSGSLTLYYFGQQLYGAVNQVLNRALVAPLVPRLVVMVAAKDTPGFWLAYQHHLRIQLGLGACGLLAFALVGQTLLQVLIGHGQFSPGHVEELWWIMIWLSGVFLGGLLGQLSSACFYALADTRTPTRIGIYSFTFYLPIKVALYLIAGVPGLALSTSAFVLLNFFVQHHLLGKLLQKMTEEKQP
jgi:putative peptidoglycan lipid II flippase